LQNQQTTVNSLLETFQEVETNLATIREKEGLINMDAASNDVTAEKKDKIMQDFQAINALMDENRKKITKLLPA
jgi:hypothetical protein